jgi:hypothetical protein
MAKIVSVKKFIDCAEPARIADVAEIRIYYIASPGPLLGADNNPLPGIPFVPLTVVPNQLSYEIDLPQMISLSEGTWMLGVELLMRLAINRTGLSPQSLWT